MKEDIVYICPQTKTQCDDECCVSAEDCHAEAINSIISNCEPEQLNKHKMKKKQLTTRTMKRITKSVIKLSDIPQHLQQDEILQGHKVHTYAEFHIDDSEKDELTLWLLNQFPTIKRKTSFLIHID